MNQTDIDELCDRLCNDDGTRPYMPPRVYGSIEDLSDVLGKALAKSDNLEPLDRLPPVAKPDWCGMLLVAANVLAWVGVVVVVFKTLK